MLTADSYSQDRLRGKKRALADTSSIILLYKSGLMDEMVKNYRIIVSNVVFDELTRNKKAGTDVFIKLQENGHITVVNDNVGSDPEIPLKGGERGIISLYYMGTGDFVVIDDKQAGTYCRAQGIPYINALLVPRILHCAGRIGDITFRESTDRLLVLGRYSNEIRTYAGFCECEKLMYFYPR